MDDFESLSNLTLQQMELLAKVITSEHTNISAESLKQIRKNERKIDTYEIKISNRIISTIVLYKPVASELRRIMASEFNKSRSVFLSLFKTFTIFIIRSPMRSRLVIIR